MRPATYSVLRYVADPARQEPLNIGIVAWLGDQSLVRVDELAVDKVVRDHPRLARDALLFVEPLVRRQIADAGGVERCIEQQSGLSLIWSEPRFTSIADDIPTDVGLEAAVERLTKRIVHPQRRYGGSSPNLYHQLETRLAPLLKTNQVTKHFFFERSRTGRPRAVDFFVNSGHNVAVDVLHLSLKTGDEITRRADAEAFKVWDIEDSGVHMVLFCDFSLEEGVRQANDAARQVLACVGADIVTTADDAVRRLMPVK